MAVAKVQFLQTTCMPSSPGHWQWEVVSRTCGTLTFQGSVMSQSEVWMTLSQPVPFLCRSFSSTVTTSLLGPMLSALMVARMWGSPGFAAERSFDGGMIESSPWPTNVTVMLSLFASLYLCLHHKCVIAISSVAVSAVHYNTLCLCNPVCSIVFSCRE